MSTRDSELLVSAADADPQPITTQKSLLHCLPPRAALLAVASAGTPTPGGAGGCYIIWQEPNSSCYYLPTNEFSSRPQPATDEFSSRPPQQVTLVL